MLYSHKQNVHGDIMVNTGNDYSEFHTPMANPQIVRLMLLKEEQNSTPTCDR